MQDFFEKYGLEPFGAVPNHRHMEWYRRGKTAFLHFTVNTFTDMEWGDGTEAPAVFDPTELDCRQWVRVLKEGGFTAAILTAKHHDGFCLWFTETTNHSVQYSPLNRDVVREFTDACREYGIKPGLYLSPWDRNNPVWGTDAYNDLYAAQLTELMTGYGKLWECWWDGAGSDKAHYDWKRWTDIVRDNQPDCVIFGCLGAAEYVDVRWVGNEEGRAGDPCYATIEPETICTEICAELNRGKWGGSRFIPAETNTSIRPGWFYHASQDDQVKTPEQLLDYWFHSAGRNTAILLNLPPDRRGLIHETDARNVRIWDDMLREVFAHNLAEDAAVTAPEGIHPDCGAKNLLTEADDRIYAASQRLPEITFTFPEPITFDSFRVDEVIELGHRIKGFALDILGDAGWYTLLERQGIGFCYADRFPEVTAKAVRLRITAADADPVLRFFGLYRGAWIQEKVRDDRGERKGLRVEYLENGVIVDLGGIYPYDCVLWNVPGLEVHAFNGTRYEKVYEGRGGLCAFPAVTGSYKLKLVVTEGEVPEGCEPRVFFGVPETE